MFAGVSPITQTGHNRRVPVTSAERAMVVWLTLTAPFKKARGRDRATAPASRRAKVGLVRRVSPRVDHPVGFFLPGRSKPPSASFAAAPEKSFRPPQASAPARHCTQVQTGRAGQSGLLMILFRFGHKTETASTSLTSFRGRRIQFRQPGCKQNRTGLHFMECLFIFT